NRVLHNITGGISCFLQMNQGSSRESPGKVQQHKSEATSFLIVSTEHRLFLLDYLSNQTREIKLALLDNKVQHCIEFWSRSAPSLVAFGGMYMGFLFRIRT